MDLTSYRTIVLFALRMSWNCDFKFESSITWIGYTS